MNDSFPALDSSAAAAPRPALLALRRPRSRRPVPALNRMRVLVLVLGGLAGWAGAMPPRLLAGAPAAGAKAAAKGPQAEPLPTISLEEVKVGQRGYGLSVFAGGQPERFDVEVIGIMRNITPDMSYIVARLSGRGLESSGVAAGMSGSPVFLDGRLAGAVSFGWPFAKEAICGITPIASMRLLTTVGGPLPVAPPPPVELAALLVGDVPGDLLARQLGRLRLRFGSAPEGAFAGVAWSASGFGELSRGVLRQALGTVAPAGRAAVAPGTAPPELVPGSSVAAVLVSGDFQLAATGTVTDHLGDRILAFGHPFLGLGPVRMPMAAAEVVTVLSSQYTSFKIANLGQTVGAFEQDRQAGIEGRLGDEAPMIPMLLRIGPTAGGSPPLRQFHVRLADVPELLPMLAGSTLLAGLESASYAGGAQSIDLTVRLRLARYGNLEVHQSFDGETAGSAMAAHLLALTAYLMQNPLERVRIEDLAVDVEQSPQPHAASLVAAHADRTVVRPGERLGINLDLVAYRGDHFRHSFDVRLPDDLPVGRYSLLIGDGASADAARVSLAPIEPTTFAQAMVLLRGLHSRRDLTLLGFYAGPGLSVAGAVMPRLPGSVRSLWSASDSGGAVPLRSAIVQERHEMLAVPLEGLLRIDLEVRRRETDGVPGERGEARERGERGAAPQPPPAGREPVPGTHGAAAAAPSQGAGR